MGNKNVSILIVDDEEPVRRFLSTSPGSDYTCVTVDSAENAIEEITKRSFQLVITDLSLPGLSGVQLCAAMKRACPDAVVIVMSGKGDIRSRVEAMRQGALYFVDKPFTTASIMKMVETALTSQAALNARREITGQSGDKSFSVRTGTGTLIS